MLQRPFILASLSVAVLGAIACSATPVTPTGSGGSSSSTTSGGGGDTSGGLGGNDIIAGTGGAGGTTVKPPAKIDETLPAGFTAETPHGGW